jgi:hypothetical protein
MSSIIQATEHFHYTWNQVSINMTASSEWLLHVIHNKLKFMQTQKSQSADLPQQ